MQFYFIRHGQSTNNRLWLETGSSNGRSEDPELTETGYKQAHALAGFLSQATQVADKKGRNTQNVDGFGFTHLYTSLMIRAVATGTAVAEALNVPLFAWEDLHERGGIFLHDELTGKPIGQSGKNRAYFKERYPDLVLPGTLGDGGWWNRPFEEPEQRSARTHRFVRVLTERHGQTEDRVAVISHGGFFVDLIGTLLALPNRDVYSFI